MKLERITIHRMPGIDDKFTLDGFTEGLNLVVGSNGSGKTTVCQAMRAMLWPVGDHNPQSISVEAAWSDGSTVWLSGREGKRNHWQKDAADSLGPALPPEQTARCYTLGMRDLLLAESSTDSEIAREILTQMAGGFNIRAVRDRIFSLPGRPGKKEADALKVASSKAGDIRRVQQALLDEENSLEELEKDRGVSVRANAEAILLGHAVEHSNVRAELGGVIGQLDSFPEGMDKIRGDELARLKEISEDLDQVEEQIADCEERAREHVLAIADAGLPDGGVEETNLGALILRARQLAERERDLKNSQVGMAGAETKLKWTKEALSNSDASDSEPVMDQAAMASVDSYLQKAVSLKAKKEAFATERGLLEGDGEQKPKQAYEQGLAALRGWLATRSVAVAAGAGMKSYLPGFLLVIAGLPPFFFKQAIGALIFGAGLALIGMTLWFRSRLNREEKRSRDNFGETGLSEPEAWELEQVKTNLADLGDRWQKAALGEQKATHLERLKILAQEAEKEDRILEAERESICSQLGIDPGITNLDLYLLAVRLKAYTDARGEVDEARGNVEALQLEVENSVTELNRGLGALGCPTGLDSSSLLAMAEKIRDRNTALKQAAEGKRREESSIEELQAALSRHRQRIKDIYSNAGLAEGDEDGFSERVRRHDHYTQAVNKNTALEGKLRELKEKLRGQENLLDLTTEEAEVKRIEAQEMAGQLGDLSESIGNIRGKVRDARHGSELEEAMSIVDAATEELAEKRKDVLQNLAGQFLLDKVMDSYEYEARPPVLEKTSKLFGRFTAHQYEVFLDTEQVDEPRLRARETATNRGKALSELSDATRMQLLLAARLAYIEQFEEGIKLPLFLDEVLTTTDPIRFEAIADSLLVMAEEGRQIFYLGANPADATLWKRTMQQKGLDPVEPIDLDEARNLHRVVTHPENLELRQAPEIPLPGSMPVEEYGFKIGVTHLDPEKPVDSMHLFYLLRGDLDTLHELLRNGMQHIGQWRSLVRSGHASSLFDDVKIKKVSALAGAAEAFFEKWWVGRGRKVDRIVLEEAGVTATFLDRLQSLVDECNGDARLLLEEIDNKRVKRFGTKQREELEDYFRENGYLDDMAPLSPAELIAGTLSAVDPLIQDAHVASDDIKGLVHEISSLLGN